MNMQITKILNNNVVVVIDDQHGKSRHGARNWFSKRPKKELTQVE